MAYKKNYKRKKRNYKVRYSSKERKAFWIGYGRRLEQLGCAGDHFNKLSNVERASMNFGGDLASKHY